MTQVIVPHVVSFRLAVRPGDGESFYSPFFCSLRRTNSPFQLSVISRRRFRPIAPPFTFVIYPCRRVTVRRHFYTTRPRQIPSLDRPLAVIYFFTTPLSRRNSIRHALPRFGMVRNNLFGIRASRPAILYVGFHHPYLVEYVRVLCTRNSLLTRLGRRKIIADRYFTLTRNFVRNTLSRRAKKIK